MWLRERLRAPCELLTLVGAFDAMSARLVARAGAEAIYAGGFAATASNAGLPDLGLLSAEEMLAHFERMRRAVPHLPFVADADAGHGGLLNVQRTIARFATIGADAVHVEDQETPKRCGHLDGKRVVARGEAIARVRAAVDEAGTTGPAIIGRSDALAPLGRDEAIRRANAFLDAGAVAVLIDAPRAAADLEAIARQVDGPVCFNAAPTGIGPSPARGRVAELGFAVVIHPIETLLAASEAVWQRAAALVGVPEGLGPPDSGVGFALLNDVLDTPAYQIGRAHV